MIDFGSWSSISFITYSVVLYVKYCQHWHNLLRSFYFHKFHIPSQFFWNWKSIISNYSILIFVSSHVSFFFLALILLWGFFFRWTNLPTTLQAQLRFIYNIRFPTRASILIGALPANNWFHKFYKWVIFWTSSSNMFVRIKMRW